MKHTLCSSIITITLLLPTSYVCSNIITAKEIKKLENFTIQMKNKENSVVRLRSNRSMFKKNLKDAVTSNTVLKRNNVSLKNEVFKLKKIIKSKKSTFRYKELTQKYNKLLAESIEYEDQLSLLGKKNNALSKVIMKRNNNKDKTINVLKESLVLREDEIYRLKEDATILEIAKIRSDINLLKKMSDHLKLNKEYITDTRSLKRILQK